MLGYTAPNTSWLSYQNRLVEFSRVKTIECAIAHQTEKEKLGSDDYSYYL